MSDPMSTPSTGPGAQDWRAPDAAHVVADPRLPGPGARADAGRRRRLPAAIAGLALAATTLGVGVAAAATSDSSGSGSDTTASAPAPGLQGRGFRGGHMFGHGMGGPSLHGEFVVQTTDGYQTVATQRGTVGSVSESSITVKSEDGFERTYAVTAQTLVNAARDGIGSMADGDTVMIVATVDGDTASAVSIQDATQLEAGMRRFAPPADGGSSQTPATGSSLSSSGSITTL